VDLTNYVLLETGQPLHVFDETTLQGPEIVVRQAREGEKLTTLNEVEHDLQPNQMMICDACRPVAAAGIMGGLETEVCPHTSRVLLESAAFKSTSIRKTRKQMGLSTEASYRFERSVDSEGVLGAARRFMELALQLGGGVPAPSFTDVYPSPPAPRSLAVRLDRCQNLLGLEFDAKEADRILVALGFQCRWEGRTVHVTAPTWRPDIQREEDVAEELGRVHGYERIPERLPKGATVLGGPQGIERWIDQVRQRSLRAGFSQTISHSLRDLHPLDGPEPRIGPRNPGSPDMAYLRNSLLASLGDNARRNGGQNLFLFEIGRVFSKAEPYAESRRLAFFAHGALRDPYLGSQEENASFFSLKAALSAALQDVKLEFSPPAQPDSRLHPTQQALVLAQDKVLGCIGVIHPDVAEAAGLHEGSVLAEVDLDAAYPFRQTEHRPKPISRNPAVRRDVAILIDRSVPYAEVERVVEQSGGDLLERHWLFDVYRGAGIPEGKHSLAIALQFRKMGSNLTDEEANQAREKVVAALEGLGATRR
jgi:phenylalanyl-tRNA synthetase beta chain